MNIQRLAEAVDEGDAPSVEAALAAGTDPNSRLRSGGTVLMRAASEGRLAVLQTLLRGGADVDAKRDDGLTALMLASFFGHEAAVAALLDGGADVTVEDIHKFTALRLASSKLHTGVIRLLEQAEAKSRRAASSILASAERPRAQEESQPPVYEQEEDCGDVRHPEPVSKENAPPLEGVLPAPDPVIRPRPVGGVRLLAVGACAVVILFAGVERTLNRRPKEPAAARVSPLAVDAGAQPVSPLAPPSGHEQTAVVEPMNVEAREPSRPNHVAESTGKSAEAVGRIEPRKVPDPRQHAAEPSVVSTDENTPPQTEPRPAEVKEAGSLPPATSPREVIVVTTPRGIPQSRARQEEPSPMVAPPVSSPAQKKKVIPWP